MRVSSFACSVLGPPALPRQQSPGTSSQHEAAESHSPSLPPTHCLWFGLVDVPKNCIGVFLSGFF